MLPVVLETLIKQFAFPTVRQRLNEELTEMFALQWTCCTSWPGRPSRLLQLFEDFEFYVAAVRMFGTIGGIDYEWGRQKQKQEELKNELRIECPWAFVSPQPTLADIL